MKLSNQRKNNMFNKSERSKFKYWFAHWCAFQMTALNLGVWKFKYLFHDMEKPFMLYWFMWMCGMKHEDAYKRVQKWHRIHRKHHLEYLGDKDYESMVIDWECSRFTKSNSPRTAYEQFMMMYNNKSDKLTKDDIEGLNISLFNLNLTK